MPEAKKPRYDSRAQSSEEQFRRVLEEFGDVQQKLQQLTSRMSEEGLEVVRQICQQYNSLKAPLYASRAEVMKKLPKFWSSVCCNHPLLSSLLTIDDTEILQSLTEVAVKEFEDSQCGFRVEFTFDENAFFEQHQLNKIITFDPDGNMIVDGTLPIWKEHMGPNGEDIPEGQKRKCERTYNFFLWFGESGTMASGVQDDMALLFKNDIWIDPMRYYSSPETEEKGMEMDQDEPFDPIPEPPAFVSPDDLLPGDPMQKTPDRDDDPHEAFD